LSAELTSGAVTDVEAFDISKWLAKLRWIDTPALRQLVNQMSPAVILEYFIRNGCGDPRMPVEAMVAHNTINRLTDRPLAENGFFFTKELFVSPQNPAVFHVLVGSATYSQDEVVVLFEQALSGGYGRDKSVGKGKIKVGRTEPFEMPEVERPNAIILLGPCAPTPNDPAEGYWQVFTRYGKLGGDWATGPGPTGTHNPFKRPLTMLQAGSVLLTDSPRPYYGHLVDNVHPEFAEVRHYGLALAMPMHCDLKEP
jgi:CRISPR-associated protein Csm4